MWGFYQKGFVYIMQDPGPHTASQQFVSELIGTLNNYLVKNRLTLFLDNSGRLANIKTIARLIFNECDACLNHIEIILNQYTSESFCQRISIYFKQARPVLQTPRVTEKFCLKKLWLAINHHLSSFKTGSLGRSELRDHLTSVLFNHRPQFIDDVPKELMLIIFGDLKLSDMRNISLVSKKWHNLSQYNALWKKFVREEHQKEHSQYACLLQTKPLVSTRLYAIGDTVVVADGYDKAADVFYYRNHFTKQEIRAAFSEDLLVKLFASEKDAVDYRNSHRRIHKDYADADVVFYVEIPNYIKAHEECQEIFPKNKTISYLIVERKHITIIWGKIPFFTEKIFFNEKLDVLPNKNHFSR